MNIENVTDMGSYEKVGTRVVILPPAKKHASQMNFSLEIHIY